MRPVCGGGAPHRQGHRGSWRAAVREDRPASRVASGEQEPGAGGVAPGRSE